MGTNGLTKVDNMTEVSSNEMYIEIINEGADNTISEETRDYISSVAYKTDNIIKATSNEDILTKEDWAQEIRSEGADNTISQAALDSSREYFNKAGRDLL